MRKASLFLLISLAYLSCKKEENIVINPAPTPMQLKIEQVISDSTLVLRWSKYTGTGFIKYRLVRNAVYLKNGQFGNFAEPVDSSDDVNHLTFTENNMPFARHINYYLYVVTYNPAPPIQSIASVHYERPNSLILCIPKDVLIDKQQKKLYIADEYGIIVVDYTTGRQIISTQFPMGIGFCSLGDFSGSKELYVPTYDGWLHILDAATLQLKEKIYVAGFAIGSVVASNEKLYVSSSDMTQGGYSNCVKVYDRATKNLMGRTGYWDQTRLIQLEGSSVEMIDLSIHLIPIDLCYYQFSPAGVPLLKKQDSYHGDYLMDPSIVRSFPDGSKFITSSSGTIFNKTLIFDRYIKQYGGYSDFGFNNDGSIIYAAMGSQKKIEAISYPTMTTVTDYTTNQYPYKIFRDGNSLVCVTKTYINQQMTYLLFEKINL
jgi:hypothetical protein